MKELDDRGIPGVMVATVEFEQAARAQSTLIGFLPEIVYVPHPIQDRTDEELQAIADGALEAVLKAITAG
ncbi:MAG: hypothetical protein O2975_05930 [Proteobacteria bacterium]|nr:hypothetical protein [Pseudomonadota bacterium]